MKKSLISIFIISASHLSASCFAWEFGARMGYRQDQICHEIFNEDISSQVNFTENFDRLRAAQVEGFTKLRLWWLEIGAHGDYSWVESGNVKSKLFLNIDPLDEEFSSFNFQSDAVGNLWDVFATGGIRFPFYSCDCNGFSVTPLGGYSIHRLSVDRKNTYPGNSDIGPFALDSLLISDPTLLSIDSSKGMTRDYCGPFAGGQIDISCCRFHTYFGYAYHWIDLNQKLNIQRRLNFFFPPSQYINNFDTTILNDNTYKTTQDPGHRAWAFIGLSDPCGWRVGFYGTYFQTETNRGSSHSDIARKNPFGVTKSTETNLQKVKWQTFSILLEGAYEF